jgi:alcohol dehydrogenase class IV
MKPSISLGVNSIAELNNLYPHKKFSIWHIPEINKEILFKIKSQLGNRIVSQHIYEMGMPDLDAVSEAQHENARNNQVKDCVILGIGGGSLMDFLKVLRFSSLNPNWLNENLNVALDKVTEDCKRQPLILMPTTAGTGSEITGTATIWDFKHKTKHSLFGNQVYADFAIVDPQLCYGAPWIVTRDSALDALSHALESIWNIHANDDTRRLAIDACQKICPQLSVIKNNLNSHIARLALSEGALLAGMAMSQTQTALAHSLSYEDTLSKQVSHGYACASWLPVVWQLVLDTPNNHLTCDFIHQAIGDFFESPMDMVRWLDNLGIKSYDPLNMTPEIYQRISMAKPSPRGRNFVGFSQSHENI